jgi:hypothetical protein
MQVMAFQMAVDLIHPMDQMVKVFQETDMGNQHLIRVTEYLMALAGDKNRITTTFQNSFYLLLS